MTMNRNSKLVILVGLVIFSLALVFPMIGPVVVNALSRTFTGTDYIASIPDCNDEPMILILPYFSDIPIVIFDHSIKYTIISELRKSTYIKRNESKYRYLIRYTSKNAIRYDIGVDFNYQYRHGDYENLKLTEMLKMISISLSSTQVFNSLDVINRSDKVLILSSTDDNETSVFVGKNRTIKTTVSIGNRNNYEQYFTMPNY